MLSKTIDIDGRHVSFRASAAVPRLYRIKFRRDIITDINKLHKAYTANKKDGKEFESIDLEVFENVAYIMARHAAPDGFPDSAEEWLDEFQMFSIYEVMPTILELWGLNAETKAVSKKKLARAVGK